MSEEKKPATQPDNEKAAEERPVPSQAEGDRQTVEENLKEQAEKAKKV